MIRLRWPGDAIDPRDAVRLDHPRLVRLRGAGPWQFAGAAGACIATMQVPGWTAEGWGPWQPGTDGAEFSLPSNPPLVESTDPARIPPDAEQVELACGERVWILPARRSARRLGFDGLAHGPATAYGVAAFALADAMAAKRYTADQVMTVALLALASVNRRLIAEVVIGRGLLSTADLDPILEAAWRLPKAPADAGTSSCEPPASTPATTPD